jgi:hypothetical protein
MWTKELTDRCSASAIDARSALRLAIGALCVLAFSALSNVGALGATGPAAATARNHYYGTFTSGICTFGNCELVAIGWWRALQRCSAIQRRQTESRVWSISPFLLIGMAEL